MIDVSILLGTVNRPALLRDCIGAARASLAGSGLTHEIVIAYGREDEPALPWMRAQPDVVPVLGGMEGAIPAFNRAYEISRGRLVCVINDDVLVDGDSIARAVRHLDAHPTCAGVVFQFDRGDGHGYRHERLSGSLHPNQIVARRSTCEAVAERIGGLWGDATHRTDKTYGGDSAFGALCRHLGLPLDSVEGVTCRDLEVRDALREANQTAPEHGRRWHTMYRPFYAGPVASQPGPDEWPNLYAPRPGMAPRRSPVEAGRPLRLLHLSLAYPGDMQEDLHRELARIGPTVALPWIGRERAAIEAARTHRPDLVWAQIQGDNWTDAWARDLRAAVGPQCTLALWTGDVRTPASKPVERWLVRAGHHFDLVLADSLTYARKLALDEKVPARCGYLQCGVDPTKNPWRPDEQEQGGVVFFGQDYPHLDGGERERIMRAITAALPGRLKIYGQRWPIVSGVDAHEFVDQTLASPIIRRTPVTICMSVFPDLVRYSSDRLKRTMCSGGLAAVRRFPDMEGLGLVDGENCIMWSTTEELITLLRDWLRPERAAERQIIRERGARLAHERFTQHRKVEELLAIVRDYRQRRGLA